MEIILASASPRRKELLEQIGVKFKICPASGEEQINSTDPSAVVQSLAQQKATEIMARQTGDVIVIGSDTVVSQHKQIMGKPKNKFDAKVMLTSLQNAENEVHTGVCVLVKQKETIKEILFSEVTTVTVYAMTAKQIEDYISTGDPMDKAGAYGIQGPFAAYIQKINGDYSNVVGLPIGRLYQECFACGIDLKQL